MIDFGISDKKQKELLNKMIKLKINEKDFEEKFIKSSGNGGQNINKNSTCVYLKHLPTGMSIKIQKERAQLLNRYYARKLLLEKIEEKISNAYSKKQKEIHKIRKQKNKRSKRAKEKILQDKKKQSEKK